MMNLLLNEEVLTLAALSRKSGFFAASLALMRLKAAVAEHFKVEPRVREVAALLITAREDCAGSCEHCAECVFDELPEKVDALYRRMR